MQQVITAFLKHLKDVCPQLPHEALTHLAHGVVVSQLPAKHFYLRAGEEQPALGYVVEGLIRAFCIDSRGSEVTINFVCEGQYASHYTAFDRSQPGRFFFQCLEPTTLIEIPKKHLEQTCNEFPLFERYVRLVLTETHNDLLSRMEGLLFDNAEARYLCLVRECPDLLQRVPLSRLCSYLGVERQHLTRIRKHLLKH